MYTKPKICTELLTKKKSDFLTPKLVIVHVNEPFFVRKSQLYILLMRKKRTLKNEASYVSVCMNAILQLLKRKKLSCFQN